MDSQKNEISVNLCQSSPAHTSLSHSRCYILLEKADGLQEISETTNRIAILSTKGKRKTAGPLHYLQRLVIKPVFHPLPSVAQEWACDQCVKTEDLTLLYIEKQLTKKRMTTKNAFDNAPPGEKGWKAASCKLLWVPR